MVYPLSLGFGFLRRPTSGIHVVVSPGGARAFATASGKWRRKGSLFWPTSTLVSHGQIRNESRAL